MGKLIDTISWKQSEADLRKKAKDQPGGLSDTVKRALAVYFDEQRTLTPAELAAMIQRAVAEGVAEGIAKAGGVVPARQPAAPDTRPASKRLIGGLFSGQ